MTSAEIRQSFLNYFADQGHTVVPSASLMPDAPNLLFTNAGMNQFVPYFLGERTPPYPRATDTQKCIRAGGKHNDLDDVGFDTRHHTFFEMLGNWSFGDYFKEEAIRWGWELSTKVWGMPKERIYATVYQPEEGDPGMFDEEAYNIWCDVMGKDGLDTSVHVIKSNEPWWMMADTGPCGPSTEMHIDLSPNGDTKGALVDGDSPLCIEFWNLVFIQFNADGKGNYPPLEQKHVDTGMGFERIAGMAATTNGFTDFSRIISNYDADLFAPYFARLKEWTGHDYQGVFAEDRDNLSKIELKDTAFRILADHVRCLSCAIADGILPGNETRNYVLRRILRRAVLWARRIGLDQGAFSSLSEQVVQTLGPVFPELKEQATVIRKVLEGEEAAFYRTIDRGLQMLDKIAEDETEAISGRDAFTLYDTYGFPVDLTEIVARERGLKVDFKGFECEMEKQREMARAAQKKSVVTVKSGDDAAATEFIGFEQDSLTGAKAKLVDIAEADGKRFLVFDRTPFYAEMGGQVGDTGTAGESDWRIRISSTTKDDQGRHLHEVTNGDLPAIGEEITLAVDRPRRQAIQRHHSATHVLHWALRKVLGKHVHQAGSMVTPDRLRFDFAHFEQPTPEQLATIERIANERLLDNDDVRWYEVPFDERPPEAMAFFGDKYGDTVRVVDIGGYSVELCGGTHVRASGEIGLLKVVGESAIAAGTRRIEAVVGESAYDWVSQQAAALNEISQKLSTKPEEVAARLERLLEQRAELEKELKSLRQKGAAAQGKELATTAIERDGYKLVVAKVDAPDPNELRSLAVQVSKELGDGAVVLGAAFGGKVTIVATGTDSAVKAGFHAGQSVSQLTAELGGKGGGKPGFAMGGGKEVARLDEVLTAFAKKH